MLNQKASVRGIVLRYVLVFINGKRMLVRVIRHSNFSPESFHRFGVISGRFRCAILIAMGMPHFFCGAQGVGELFKQGPQITHCFHTISHLLAKGNRQLILHTEIQTRRGI